MPITVTPGMAPITVSGGATPTDGSSTKVKFIVSLPEVLVTVTVLVTLCIKIKIGSLTVYIYYSKVVVINVGVNPPAQFEVLLPTNSVIEAASATFDELYPVI